MDSMKRKVMMTIMSFFYILSFAQRGRGFRPEWDMESFHNQHSVDDDMWSFLFVIGLIIIIFAYYFFKGLAVRQKEKAKMYEKNNNTKDVENGCCLIYTLICIIAFVAGLVVPWLTADNSDVSKLNKKTGRAQRKDKTMVVTIISEDDYKQSHIASKDEFAGKDTCFYYEGYIYQNKTGKELTEYLIKYDSDGSKTLEVLKTIKPNQYFKSRVVLPFEDPPTSVEFKTYHTNYGNWKSRSRWGNKKETTKYMNFINYSDYVSNLPIQRK